MTEKERTGALQALALLDQVAASVGSRAPIEASRAAHVQYQQAVATIKAALELKEKGVEP